MTIPLSERIIAFIDILGFESLVSDLEQDERLHQRLQYALQSIKRIKISSLSKNTAQKDLEVSVFSDCIAISAAQDNYHGVIWTAIHLQSSLLVLGILARGGISKGKLVHEDDILYGEGMIKAYKLESKAAIYPRILIDREIIEITNEQYRSVFFQQDMDGLWHLNPFSIGLLPGGADELAADGWDPHEVGLNELKRHIDKSVSTLTKPDQIAKWNWIERKCSEATEQLKVFGKPKFWIEFEKIHGK